MQDPITKRAIKENGYFYLNSKSIFFEAHDHSIPIYKFLFSSLTKNETYNTSDKQKNLIKCPKKLEYNENEAILEFKTKKIFEIKVTLKLH
jgi:hypothetical protein